MAKRWEEVQCELHADKAGVLWDLLLYVPTVGFLLLMGVRLWYAHGDDEIVGQVLMFLGFFFLMVGGARVMRRLLVMPSSPIALDINRERIRLKQKNGQMLNLLKDIRFFADHAGKSFGLTGSDEYGVKKQFVFHRNQFNEADFDSVIKSLERYK
ncbi:MAG: hypothetical protein CO186_02315 [Zetaproteobacteria bacterium CG_4_9_14_3_um_filter_49_83]|nr:MAG: hypothetical protein AUJ56_06360 [Zetaproteobacteria bacterium CG1_02_49_23]PIQ33441.1 MAG: hypothetical protein COW62_05080 [Zetaproteobacteria bacterium CG17_big_fil_post_rev_8_21_14_2_50_50_13]PIV29110.1 MAG: hypothetical protein COS35_13805 [Zetaproteobacteria bacterium CG02_land_8_20_14_3_00_50_9]PIY55648.1 MAG: hypothetical protein COZ00_08145 [Zetaproteobacteria bacterium CG_4_10_14_0_8_um_filter_49_80]PJA35998.1 MAG: hypothetical protein CO186_02315 [Zetaproteobacteria bacterium